MWLSRLEPKVLNHIFKIKKELLIRTQDFIFMTESSPGQIPHHHIMLRSLTRGDGWRSFYHHASLGRDQMMEGRCLWNVHIFSDRWEGSHYPQRHKQEVLITSLLTSCGQCRGVRCSVSHGGGEYSTWSPCHHAGRVVTYWPVMLLCLLLLRWNPTWITLSPWSPTQTFSLDQLRT